MDSRSEPRKTRRKIRTTQDLNEFNRKSLYDVTRQTYSGKKVTRKKKSNLNLPKINIENISPNISPVKSFKPNTWIEMNEFTNVEKNKRTTSEPSELSANSTFSKQDDVFEIDTDENKKRDTFEKKKSFFEISILPDISPPYKNKRRSKSLEIKTEKSTLKNSVGFTKSILRNSRKSVTFSQSDKYSIGLSFPKSPHPKKTNSFTDINAENQLKDISFGVSPNGATANFNETSYKQSSSESDFYLSPIEKVTRRKKWNKSLSASILNSSFLNNVSIPWENQSKISCRNFLYSENSSDENLNSPIKTDNSLVQKYKQITEKTSTKKTFNASSSYSSSSFSSFTGVEKKEKKVKIKAMPNFAAIHERIYEKCENLKDMTERKAKRANLLLSGRKPDTKETLPVQASPLKKKSPKSRKLLSYASPKKPTWENFKNNNDPALQQVPGISGMKKENRKPFKTKIPKLVNKVTQKISVKKKEIPQQKTIRKQEFQTSVNKVQVQKNTTETRRNCIEKYRSNRRFELLMKMRQKNKA